MPSRSASTPASACSPNNAERTARNTERIHPTQPRGAPVIDPELQPIVDLLPKIDLSDPPATRAAFEKMLEAMRGDIPGIETLDIEDRMVPGWEGDPDVSVRIYRPKERLAASPAVLLIHGGGFVVGSVDAEHANGALVSIHTGAVVMSVEYRLAPEHPYPAALHDCYMALCNLAKHADELGVDPARIAINGTSA